MVLLCASNSPLRAFSADLALCFVFTLSLFLSLFFSLSRGLASIFSLCVSSGWGVVVLGGEADTHALIPR